MHVCMHYEIGVDSFLDVLRLKEMVRILGSMFVDLVLCSLTSVKTKE